MQPIIRLEHVTAAYDGKIALQDVSLTVFDHDFLGIIGPNGGGKTTLIRIILGLMKPVSGQVVYLREGRSVPEITMGYLPQYNAIDRRFPISVYEVVLSGLSRQKRFLRPYTRSQHEQVCETLRKMELESLKKMLHRDIKRGPITARSFGTCHRITSRSCNT